VHRSTRPLRTSEIGGSAEPVLRLAAMMWRLI
jgi:hypothetical protein